MFNGDMQKALSCSYLHSTHYSFSAYISVGKILFPLKEVNYLFFPKGRGELRNSRPFSPKKGIEWFSKQRMTGNEREIKIYILEGTFSKYIGMIVL